jgi:hypothetical protein
MVVSDPEICMDFWEIELPRSLQFYIDIKVSGGAETWGVTNVNDSNSEERFCGFL